MSQSLFWSETCSTLNQSISATETSKRLWKLSCRLLSWEHGLSKKMQESQKDFVFFLKSSSGPGGVMRSNFSARLHLRLVQSQPNLRAFYQRSFQDLYRSQSWEQRKPNDIPPHTWVFKFLDIQNLFGLVKSCTAWVKAYGCSCKKSLFPNE